MSNQNRKISGVIFLIILIIVGIILAWENVGGDAGWTLVTLGGLGLFGIMVDWAHNEIKKNNTTGRPIGISIVAVLMIVFGLAEIATGFTHNFLGLVSTAAANAATYGGAGIGSLYAIGGCFLFAMKKWAAIVAEVCLALVVIGRISLVIFGLYPLNSSLQTFSIIVGTALAIFFAIYIGAKWKCFK